MDDQSIWSYQNSNAPLPSHEPFHVTTWEGPRMPAAPMDDLVTWLRAQIDEDERVALAIGSGTWTHSVIQEGPDQVLLIDDRVISAGFWEDDPLRPSEVAHIARHDPARVLREVAAKRALLDFCESAAAAAYPDFDGGYASALEEVIPYLALVYSDRDGYRPEWAPEPSG